MMPECQIRAYRVYVPRARDTTLDDEKYNWHNIGAGWVGRTCVVVTALCNQPEAFVFDLDDD